MAEVHPLRPHALADVGEQEPLADRGGEVVAVVAGDQGDHHVERRDAARAGDAVAVEDEERRNDVDLREGLVEGGRMLPVERGAAAVEKAGPREHVGPAGDAADGDALAREAAQPGEGGAVVEGGRIAAGADEDEVGRGARRFGVKSGMMATPFEAATGPSARRGVPPAVQGSCR